VADWPPGSPAPLQIRAWCDRLRGFADLDDLHSSDFWRAESASIEDLLATPHVGRRSSAGTGVGPRARIVHWNILKGIAYEGLRDALLTHPALRDTDVLLLNEVDVGMARSGNRHVAAALGRDLDRDWVYQPNYLELTKGPAGDALAPGQNETGLHGVAILTRAAPLAWAPIELPECFQMFSFHEKRLGRRTGLVLSLPGGLVVGTAHHEVRGMPRCRAEQTRAFLAGVQSFCEDETRAGRPPERVILSGDLNTHTFLRGDLQSAIRGALRLLFTPQGALRRQFLSPWLRNREPLFSVLREAGYRWQEYNRDQHTAHAPLPVIEEGDRLPRALHRLLSALLPFQERGIPLHLDWFFGRGLPDVGVKAQTIDELAGDGRPSDHAPILLDLPG